MSRQKHYQFNGVSSHIIIIIMTCDHSSSVLFNIKLKHQKCFPKTKQSITNKRKKKVKMMWQLYCRPQQRVLWDSDRQSESNVLTTTGLYEFAVPKHTNKN